MKMKKRVAMVLAVCALLLLGGCKARKPAVGAESQAPQFNLTDIDGKPLNLADYKGKVVLLDFWATWCGPCKVEIPHYIEMQKKYGAQGFQVIGLSMDDDAKPVKDFYQKMGMNYPVAVANEDLAQKYGGVLGLPVGFIIDKNGKIVSKHVGETQPEVFEEEIKKLL